MPDHRVHSEQLEDADRRLLRLTIEALLAEGATLVEAIEQATMLVRGRWADRGVVYDGAASGPKPRAGSADGPASAQGAPPSGTREVGAEGDAGQLWGEPWPEAASS